MTSDHSVHYKTACCITARAGKHGNNLGKIKILYKGAVNFASDLHR